jgi:hypothetical protein
MEKVTLSHLNELAYRSFYWTSFSPDKRGKQTIDEHEEQLNSDLESMPESEHDRYKEKYIQLFTKWLSAHSRCASSFITGGSGFNVRKAEKANDSERKRYEEFSEWREKALKAISKKIENDRPESEKRSEAWRNLEKDILRSASIIHGINMGIERGYSKPLFVSSLYNKVETYANKGDVEIVQMAVDRIRKFNETMSVVITERHKFFKLVELAESKQEKKEESQTKENQELEIVGGKAVYNFQADRLQLIFDEKPSADIISQLKKSGFRWSPTFGSWQRQLTGNAIFATKHFLKSNNLYKSAL